MAINFPHNPNINDVHTEASLGRSWKWDGTTWLIYSSTTTGIAFGDLSVSQQAASGSGSLTYNNAGVFTYTPPAGGGGGGSSTFTGLNDTPSSLTAGKWLKVNTGGTALEWTDAPTGNDTNDYLNTASLTGNILTLTRTGSQSLSDVTVNLSSLNSVPTNITVADESTDTECYPLFSNDPTGNIEPKTGSNIKFNALSGQLEAGSFKKTGGTAAEFLKADGSIDSNTYSQTTHTHSYALNDLSDVTTGTISDGDVLKYSGTNGRWEALPDATGGGGSSLALNDLTNVDAVTGAANGKILKYNGTSWEIADDLTGGGGSGNFTGLSDTPNSFTAGKWLKVNAGATSLEYTDAPSDNNTTYDLTAANGNDSYSEKIQLSGNDNSEDSVTLAVDSSSSLTIARSGNTITFGGGGGSGGATTLGGLTDVDTSGAADGKILTYVGTEWQAGSWIQANWTETNANLSSYIRNKPVIFSGDYDDLTNKPVIPTNNNQLTNGAGYTTFDGDYNSLSNTPTLFSGSYNDLSNKPVIPAAQIQSDWNQSSTSALDFIKNKPTNILTAESDTLGTVTGRGATTSTACEFAQLDATGVVTAAFLNVKDPKIVLNSDFSGSGPTEDAFLRVERGSSADVNIKWNESSDKWQVTNDGSNYFNITNNYNDLTNQPTIPTNNNQLTNGAGYTTFNGSYNSLTDTPTIPTNNNQLTNGAGYITSSGTVGTATNANNVKIRTDNGAAWHYPLFVDSNSDNQNQTLKVDTSGMKYYPSLGWLQNSSLQSFLMYDWNASSGSAGQVLTSQGSSQWSWTTPSSGGMTGNSKITVKTSGSGTHTTQSWCKTVIALAVGGGGGGGNAWYQYDDDDGLSQGRGGTGGSGGHKYYTASVSGATGIAYSIGGGGSGQSQGNCDDNVANGASGGSTTFGGVTAGGGGGGSGTWYGTGSNGANGSGDAIFFQTAYGAGGAGANGRSGDGCQGSAGSGTGGAVFILELG